MNKASQPTPNGIRARDAATGGYRTYCVGPLPDGSCPRVRIGEVVDCAGLTITPAWSARPEPYRVQGTLTLCPLTLARALAVPIDTAFAGVTQ